ncbi:TIGR04326 family surface carbohydrate biosynthesis protein [Spirulina sp. CCNP1310]|nr:TIGR04326 family surface carbohydrate biosynthesis protein [Spirulina sp. CCNP1310]
MLWRSFPGNDDTNVISIPKLVEEQADELRTRYLAWLYDLGESKIQGVRLIDRLAIRPTFSYWWMTLPALCSYEPQSPIYTVIRLLALEEIHNQLSPKKILLVSSNKLLAQTMRLWCKKIKREFKWERIHKTTTQLSLVRKIYASLPYSLQAVISLFHYIWQRRHLTQQKIDWTATSDADVTFVNYLCNLTPKALSTGHFSSHYWTSLVNVLSEEGLKSNWIHHYIKHPDVPLTQKAEELIAKFNQNGTNQQFHLSLDNVLSISIILAVIRDYMRLASISFTLKSFRDKFFPAQSSINLWPLLKQDWYNSITGPNSISNCLFLNLFERLLAQIPPQKLGIFLQENQSWEMAFIYAWRTSEHGQLIGVPHSTVRYWDLRYFFDPRSYDSNTKNKLPMPNFVAVNGPVSMKMYQEGGYPKEQIIEVEALRYLALADEVHHKSQVSSLKLLVLGDYFSDNFHQQMLFLEKSEFTLSSNIYYSKIYYTVKPHPILTINSSDYPTLKFQISNLPLVELLPDHDVVFTSNGTSAAVDAYCTGVPVISLLDGNSFNISPLKGLKNTTYVSSPSELTTALLFHINNETKNYPQTYFRLDQNIPRWKTIIKQICH